MNSYVTQDDVCLAISKDEALDKAYRKWRGRVPGENGKIRMNIDNPSV